MMMMKDDDDYDDDEADFGKYPRVFLHRFEVFILDRPIAAPLKHYDESF